MDILLGFILFLAAKLISSTDVSVQGIVGSSATLACPLTSTDTYQWQMYVNGIWFNTITNSVKYESAYTQFLTIKDLNLSDDGIYRCTTVSGTQGYVNLTIIDPSFIWSEWGTWSACNVICGGGQQSRVRNCQLGFCTGGISESRNCNTSRCPGVWTEWTTWSPCTQSCGVGQQIRSRSCSTSVCEGNGLTTLDCNTFPCPVNGQWGIWGHWSSCSVTCDGGIFTRQRFCDNPMPAHRGSDCDDNSTETLTCSVNKCQDSAKTSMSVAAVIAGTMSACVVLLTVALAVVFVLRRRRQKNAEKHNDYAVSDMREGEEHFYIQTTRSNDYCNTDLRSSVQVKNKEVILAEYNSSELSKMFLDKQLCEKQIQDEFQWLTKNKHREHGTDYEEVNVPVKNESYDTYVNTTIVKTNDTNCVSMVTEIPNTNNIEMFWTLVNNFKVHDIILLVQKKEKITDFFPMTDEPIEMQGVEVKLINSGRQENHIFVYSLELTDQERKTVIEIRLYKTTNWKIGDTFPDISTLCKLITNLNGNRTGVLMTGSKDNGYRMCGVFVVCLEVVNTIKDEKKFSILQIALDMVKTRPDLFQTFEEYELCYNILRHYLENQHGYAVIT